VTKDILKTKKETKNVAGVPGSQSTLADSRAINPSFVSGTKKELLYWKREGRNAFLLLTLFLLLCMIFIVTQ